MSKATIKKIRFITLGSELGKIGLLVALIILISISTIILLNLFKNKNQ